MVFGLSILLFYILILCLVIGHHTLAILHPLQLTILDLRMSILFSILPLSST